MTARAATLNKLLTLQLRPHVSMMLDNYIDATKQRLPANVRDKVTRSVIVRALLKRDLKRPTLSLAWLLTGRKRDGMGVQMRVRLTETEYALATAASLPYAQWIAALILEASYPDGNYPENPDSKIAPTTKDHQS
jgi:hypothetical protein